MLKSLKTVMAAAFLALPLSVELANPAVANSTTITQGVETGAWPKIVAPVDLDAAQTTMPGIQIIDIRAQKYLKKGTIRGAVSIPYKSWRGPKSRPGQPPSEEALAELIGEAGIQLDRPIVIVGYSGKAFHAGQAAFVYWLLKTAGAEQASILHGGIKAWRADDLAMAAEPITLPPTEGELDYRMDWWASPVEIFAVVTGQKDGSILDARLDSQVKKSVETGKPMTSMPLARYVPASWFTDNLSDRKLSVEEQNKFLARLLDRGIDPSSDVLISICQTGELSALSWFYASEVVGLDNVQYYPDALQGWRADGGVLFGLDTGPET